MQPAPVEDHHPAIHIPPGLPKPLRICVFRRLSRLAEDFDDIKPIHAGAKLPVRNRRPHRFILRVLGRGKFGAPGAGRIRLRILLRKPLLNGQLLLILKLHLLAEHGGADPVALLFRLRGFR